MERLGSVSDPTTSSWLNAGGLLFRHTADAGHSLQSPGDVEPLRELYESAAHD
jgi:hypothetical protein